LAQKQLKRFSVFKNLAVTGHYDTRTENAVLRRIAARAVLPSDE